MSRNQRSQDRKQRGALSVEFALLMPLMLLVIVGGVYFGRVLMTRHKVTEATNYATRAAAVQKISNANQIRNLIQNRLGTNSGCSAIAVTATTQTDALGLTQLRVTATCTLGDMFGSSLLGAVGPNDLTVTTAMPF